MSTEQEAAPSSAAGCVYLVGAGPGDPGLITLRGKELLEKAEVVVFDYLANPQLLRHCPTAETIYVGKQAASHAMTQDQINELLVERGLEGKRVVRLKGGDPFVFGRGGEECQALADAGIRFEVVPGITAALAGTAYAGIPITHRDVNSCFTIVTGHEKEEDYQDPQAKSRGGGGASDLDWRALAKMPALAFYMGIKALPRICQRLMDGGMDPATPAASIQWATTPRQRTVVATVGDLPQKIEEAGLKPPAITIVGQVVKLRETISWFETRPLFGRTVIVTRTRQQASALSSKLEELGARVIEAPTIETAPPADWAEVDQALLKAGEYDWVIFTSTNGVRAARARMLELGADVRMFGGARIAAVGLSTAAAIREQLLLKVDLCPRSFTADALGDELLKAGEVKGKRFLMLRADIARSALREQLTQGAAAQVADLAIYQTRPAGSLPPVVEELLDAGQVDWVTFTSSSTARNFLDLLGRDGQPWQPRLAGVKLASIGPITSKTMRELSLKPDVEATAANIDALVDAIAAG